MKSGDTMQARMDHYQSCDQGDGEKFISSKLHTSALVRGHPVCKVCVVFHAGCPKENGGKGKTRSDLKKREVIKVKPQSCCQEVQILGFLSMVCLVRQAKLNICCAWRFPLSPQPEIKLKERPAGCKPVPLVKNKLIKLHIFFNVNPMSALPWEGNSVCSRGRWGGGFFFFFFFLAHFF